MNEKLNFNTVISKTLDYYKNNWKAISLYSLYYTLSALLIGFITGFLAGLSIFGTIVANNQDKIRDISGKIFTNDGRMRQAGVKLSESDISFLWSQGLIALSIFALVAILISMFVLPFLINLYDSILKLIEEKEVNYFSFNKNYFRIFLTILLHSLIVSLGYLFFVIPGIYLTVRLYPMLLIAINEHLSPVQAMNRAFELTKNNFWNIALSAFLPALIYSVFLGLIVGLLNESGLASLVQVIISIFAVGFFVLLDINIYKGLTTTRKEEVMEASIVESV